MIVTTGLGLRWPTFVQIKQTRKPVLATASFKDPNWQTAAKTVARPEKFELTLTNPKHLYLMADFLKKEFYDKENYFYPIKTTCDGELIETEFFCPFEPKLSPHYAKLFDSRDERSKLYAVPPNTTDMKKYNRINCEKFGSFMAPNSNYEDTEMVALFYSMMYYLNDQTAHLKLPEEEIQPELVDELNDHLLQYLDVFLSIFEPRNPEDLDRIWNFLEFYQPYFKIDDGKILLDERYHGRTPPQIGLIKKMTSYIWKRFAQAKNITQVIYEVIRYVKGIKQEIKIRGDKSFTLTLKEYDQFRDQVTSSPMAHSITDLTRDDFSYRTYLNPLFIELENLTSEIITYYNDVCTCGRERLDDDPFNSVFILRDLHDLNYVRSCELVVKHSHDKLKRFLDIKQRLLDEASDENEYRAISQMVRNREDSLIGYVLHEICCVSPGYARDHKPMMKEFLENSIFLGNEAKN